MISFRSKRRTGKNSFVLHFQWHTRLSRSETGRNFPYSYVYHGPPLTSGSHDMKAPPVSHTHFPRKALVLIPTPTHTGSSPSHPSPSELPVGVGPHRLTSPRRRETEQPVAAGVGAPCPALQYAKGDATSPLRTAREVFDGEPSRTGGGGGSRRPAHVERCGRIGARLGPRPDAGPGAEP